MKRVSGEKNDWMISTAKTYILKWVPDKQVVEVTTSCYESE